ncbi:MAG: hypothetical protein ABIO92_03845 [Chloroflexia bacterium]
MPKPYPWYYAVNDRPVKIVLLPDGSADCLVFDFTTGGFIPDRSYLSRTLEVGIGKDVDQFTEAEFEQIVAELRQLISEERQATPIAWELAVAGVFPYHAQIKGRTFTIRVNDFPDEPLYTLLIDGEKVEDLEDWPQAWVRPGIPKALLDIVEENRKGN